MKNQTRSILGFILVFHFLAAVGVVPTWAATCNVPSQYATISAAIAGTSCTQIEVASGTYMENLVIIRGVTIRGSFGPGVIIDGGKKNSVITIDTIEKVSLVALTLQNGRGQSNGGGILINHGNVEIVLGRIINNVAPSNGGGIFTNQPGNKLVMYDSQVSGNSTEQFDGGGLMLGNGEHEIVNTTIYGNQSAGNGGGVYAHNSGVVHIRSCTIAGNKGNTKLAQKGRGGGFYDSSSGNTVTFANTIMAGNLDGGIATASADCRSGDGVSLGYNLVGIGDDCPKLTALGDLVGTLAVPLNAGLGTIQRGDYEQVQTLPLLAGSPAIDRAHPMGSITAQGWLLGADARAARRPMDGDGNGMARDDIGAYEKDGDLLPNQVFYIPTSAHSGGTGGTNWRTDIEVQNPSTQRGSFIIELLKKDIDNSIPQATQTLQLDAGVAARYPDVLLDLFQFNGTGAIRVTVTGPGLLVNSRTYNLLSAGNPLGLPDGSTFGQFVPVFTLDQAVTVGQTARLIHLSHTNPNLKPAKGYRTNIGFVNMSNKTVEIIVDLYNKTGALFGTVQGDVTRLLPYSFRQVNSIFDKVTPAEVADGYAVVRTTTTGARFVTYASVTDNRTGDPIFVTQIRM